jgi:hypothetical protein
MNARDGKNAIANSLKAGKKIFIRIQPMIRWEASSKYPM